MPLDDKDWFLMTPTEKFVELMFKAEDDGLDMDEFTALVQAEFRKEHPKHNKTKPAKIESVRAKVRACNKQLKKHDVHVSIGSGGSAPDYGELAARRKKNKK